MRANDPCEVQSLHTLQLPANTAPSNQNNSPNKAQQTSETKQANTPATNTISTHAGNENDALHHYEDQRNTVVNRDAFDESMNGERALAGERTQAEAYSSHPET